MADAAALLNRRCPLPLKSSAKAGERDNAWGRCDPINKIAGARRSPYVCIRLLGLYLSPGSWVR